MEWINYQRTLVEYCKFADICHHVQLRDKQRMHDIIASVIKTDLKREADKQMSSAFYNLEYSMKDIFDYHDAEDEILYRSEVLCESVVDYLDI
jgi:hypothetical protein